MTTRPPNGPAALAAVTTPVVAAALLVVALAAGCGPRPSEPPAVPSSAMASTPSSTPPSSPASVLPPDSAAPPSLPAPATGRLVIVTSAREFPRATVHGSGPGDGTPLDLPPGATSLAALPATAGGGLAAVAPDGRAWVVQEVAGGPDPAPTWAALPVEPPATAVGRTIGATWSTDGEVLLLLAGDPGSGAARSDIVTLAPGDRPASAVTVPLEADGPSIAALPGGGVAFIGRAPGDRIVLALATPTGDVRTLPTTARAVVAGGTLAVIATDGEVLAGPVGDLVHGILPATPLPFPGDGRIGTVAVSTDGRAVAAVRLDDTGESVRVDVVERSATGWQPGATIPVGPGAGSVLLAWLP